MQGRSGNVMTDHTTDSKGRLDVAQEGSGGLYQSQKQKGFN